MNAQASKPKVGKKPKGKTVWFVEFCCAKHSEISKLADEMQIPYIGLSKEVCDLSNPHHMQQVMLWAKERGELGESFHLGKFTMHSLEFVAEPQLALFG